MKLAARLIPKGLQERAQPMIRRAEAFVRDFEWTWTKAVVGALLLWIIGITGMAVIPSYWLYLADQKLSWRATGCGHSDTVCFWLFKARDAVAAGLYTGPFVTLIVVPYFVQKWRRRLRSESESRPTGGYR
jgi:hypothetical protein